MSKTTEVEAADLRSYELMVIVVPNISEDDTNQELDKIRELIKSYGGEISHEDIWGNRTLAYTIAKHDTGYYAVFNFEAPTNLLPELNKTLKIETKILRFLIIKPPKAYVIKSQSQFEKEAEEMKAKELERKETSPKKKTESKPKKAEAKSVKKEAPKAAAKVEKKEEVKEEKTAKPAKPAEKKEEKKTLDELDAKLKSIIDDPDITL